MTYYEAKELWKEYQAAHPARKKETPTREPRTRLEISAERSLGDDVKGYYIRHGYI